jgi:hypothetical protein
MTKFGRGLGFRVGEKSGSLHFNGGRSPELKNTFSMCGGAFQMERKKTLRHYTYIITYVCKDFF